MGWQIWISKKRNLRGNPYASLDNKACIIWKMSLRHKTHLLVALFVLIVLLTACRQPEPSATGTSPSVLPSEAVSTTPEPSPTPVPPSPTPIPLAAMVNGETITLAEFQAELERFQAATTITGTFLASETNTLVLDELIDQILLAQGAEENGLIVDDTLLQSRIGSLESRLGSPQALADWIAEHGYSNDEFEQSLQRAIASAWMRDQVVAGVPQTADQVHVKQILLPTAFEAEEVHTSLDTGNDFLELAATYEPLTKGDLGWFPRSYLDEPAIDEAAFSLQPGQYSPVVQTAIGYHILYLVERDPEHPLQPDVLQKLQVEALRAWLDDRRSQSEIQVFLP